MPDAGKPTLSGALALLFDRAAALFGTKAAAAERHRATMRRCISLKIARRAAIWLFWTDDGPWREMLVLISNDFF